MNIPINDESYIVYYANHPETPRTPYHPAGIEVIEGISNAFQRAKKYFDCGYKMVQVKHVRSFYE